MGVDFHLEFYVPKRPLDRQFVHTITRTIEEGGYALAIDEMHVPAFGDPGHARWTFAQRAAMGIDETLDLLVTEGGGSLPFTGKALDLWLRIYPNGQPANKERAKGLGENLSGEVPLGSVDITWMYLRDEEETRRRLKETLTLGRALYPVLRPVIGMGYQAEIDDTEASILRDGPRHVYTINFWSPEMAEWVDYSALRSVPGLVVEDLPDRGVLISRRLDQPMPEWADLNEVSRLLRRR